MTIADELSKLAELRASGVLTHDEFATEKASLLAGTSGHATDDGYDDADYDDDDSDLLLPTHAGAQTVRTVFLSAAVLTAVAGVIAGIAAAVTLTHHQVPGATTVGVTFGIVIGSFLVGASFAFFGYVVDLLIEVDCNTRGLRYWTPLEDAEDDE
jgi:hypothetical protein